MMSLTWWYARQHQRIYFSLDTDYIRHILGLSLPYGIALFLNVLFFKADTVLLSLLEPRDIADTAVALYALPMKIVEVGMMYGTIFLNSLLPVLTQSLRIKDDKTVSSLTGHAFELLFGFGISIAI